MFTHEALAAWEALETRFAAQLSLPERDLLFARFVLGLTSPIHGQDEPIVHLTACREILALKLTPERIDRALNTVPEISEPWVGSAYESMEALGTKEGRELAERQRTQRTNSGTRAEASSLQLVRTQPGGIV
jgi:hypothetical protein